MRASLVVIALLALTTACGSTSHSAQRSAQPPGSLEALWKQSGEKHVKPDDWNDYTIEAVGSRVRTWINGKLCVDLEDDKIAKSGVIAVQVHAGGPTEVRFKDLELEVNPKWEMKTVKE